MKCDDFLAAHESQSAWQQWRAKRHARRCPSCAATARAAAELVRELSQVEPLTAAQRELWTQAIVEEVRLSVPPLRSDRFGVLALAAVLLLGITAALVGWHGNGRRPNLPRVATSGSQGSQQPQTAALARTIDAADELNGLLASVDALAAELNATRRKAELLDARLQAETMIVTYNLW